MLHLAFFVEHAVEGRFRGDVLAAVGERGHDLSRALVAELGRVGDLEQGFTLGLGELVRRRRQRACAPVLAAVLSAPALYGAHAEVHQLAGLEESRAGRDGFVEEVEHHSSFPGLVSSSASPQIARTFF
jgi:hypothetical protein